MNSTQFKILKIAAICAISLAVLVVGGLGLEMLHTGMLRNDLRKAADAAALAGACSVEFDAAKATNDALSVAARNSANGAPVSNKSKETNVNVQVIRPPNGAPVVGVTAKLRVTHFLQGIFGHPNNEIAVTSYAGPVGTVNRVDQGRVFPLAMNIDQLSVPKGLNQSAPMTINLRLGGKATSFVTFKEDNKGGDSLKKLIAVATKGGAGAEKTIPSVSLGDTLYISRNSTLGQAQLATPDMMKSLTGKTILLPVVSVGRRKTKVQVIGFINGRVENVHRSRRLVDSISLKIVKATGGATSGKLKATGTIQNDRALREFSAAAVKLVSLPAEQSNDVAVANRASTNAARSKSLLSRKIASARTEHHAETSSLELKSVSGDAPDSVLRIGTPGGRPLGKAVKIASATVAGKAKAPTAVTDSVAGSEKSLAPSVSSKISAKAMAVQGTTAAKTSVIETTVKKVEMLATKSVLTQPPALKSTKKVQKDIVHSPEDTIAAAVGAPRIASNQALTKTNENANKLQEAPSNAKAKPITTGEKNATPSKPTTVIPTPTKVEKTVAKPSVVAAMAPGGMQQTADKVMQAKAPSEKSGKLLGSSPDAKTEVKTLSTQGTAAAKSSTDVEQPKKIENVTAKLKIPEKNVAQVASSPVLPGTAGDPPAIQAKGAEKGASNTKENRQASHSKWSMTDTELSGSPAKANADIDAPASAAETVSAPSTVDQTMGDAVQSLELRDTSPSRPISFKVGMNECLLLIGGLLVSLALVWTYRISKQRGADGDRLRKTFKPAKAQEDSESGGKGTLIVAPATLRASRGKAMQHWGLKKDPNVETEERNGD
ncbi:MAG: hypothetical protein K2W95_20885 [Candidatus Obscuribacterales bacterium]|nr:hypothetical protein [Candidatus Obscuribacterales bacterium]